jgi:membrane protease subunit HflK
MRVLRILLVVVALAWLATGLVQVRRGERAVVRRFGQVLAYQPEPGLWIGLPLGIDRVDRVEVDSVRSVEVGYSDEAGREDGLMPPGQLLTGDNNLVNARVTVYFKVRPEGIVDFVIQGERIGGVLSKAVEATLAEWVAGQNVDEVLLRGKNALRGVLIEAVRERIVSYRLGIEILDARVTQLAPPDEVKDSFDRVSQAQTQIVTQRNKAEQEAASRLQQARSERFRIEQEAQATAKANVVIAEQEARRFTIRLEQYRQAMPNNPAYLEQIWQEERGKIFGKLRENGQLDLLDNRLGSEGLDLVIVPRLPGRR